MYTCISPRKHANVISLGKITSMMVRDITAAVNAGKLSVSRIPRRFNVSESWTQERRGKCGGKQETTPRTNKMP